MINGHCQQAQSAETVKTQFSKSTAYIFCRIPLNILYMDKLKFLAHSCKNKTNYKIFLFKKHMSRTIARKIFEIPKDFFYGITAF